MAKQNGLDWKQDFFGLLPNWTTEPNLQAIETLTRKHLALDSEARCEIQFYAQGAINKLYRVTTDSDTLLMRVSLPVDPHHKTMSEVASTEYSDNELGFEWILMEMMPGQPLRKAWTKLPMSAKEGLVKQLAGYQAKLFNIRFNQIGSVYQTVASRDGATGENICRFNLGRVVSHVFFWGDRLMHDDIFRGPFFSSHGWLYSQLVLTLRNQENILKISQDEDDIEDATNAKDIVQKLLGILPGIFPQAEKPSSEPTIVHHDDLSMQNILVDEAGHLTAVVDWECVTTMPLWRACQTPGLLEGRDRDEYPRLENYSTETSEGNESPTDSLDTEGVSSLYWEHLLEYEQTHLRQVFMVEMRRLRPGWLENSKSKQAMLKADFERAVNNADNGFCFKVIREWVDAYMAGEGEVWSLIQRMLQ